MKIARLLRTVLGATAVLCAVAAGFTTRVAYDYHQAWLHSDDVPRKVTVLLGAGPSGVHAALERAGIASSADRLQWILRWRGDAAKLKAGIYEVRRGQSLRELLDAIAAGTGRPAVLRLVEGLTLRQVRAVVDVHPDLVADARALDDATLIARIGVPFASGEGVFLPDTYHFAPGSSALSVYREAWRAMERVLVKEWEARQPGLPLESPWQALVLASIIEKETGRAEDRALVSAVFVNRLKRGMPLQSDPTTIYALGSAFDGRLRRRDLQADLPHNTYVRTGLPPTPIALPGRAAIEAALRPASSQALFFVARGDGSTEFSDDLKAHNRAVERYVLKR
ncbi:MAG: endolytic transglycosylase MltG [Betaproteobacteria bacterium]